MYGRECRRQVRRHVQMSISTAEMSAGTCNPRDGASMRQPTARWSMPQMMAVAGSAREGKAEQPLRPPASRSAAGPPRRKAAARTRSRVAAVTICGLGQDVGKAAHHQNPNGWRRQFRSFRSHQRLIAQQPGCGPYSIPEPDRCIRILLSQPPARFTELPERCWGECGRRPQVAVRRAASSARASSPSSASIAAITSSSSM